MVTRLRLVVKIGLFSLKNGDEIEARRQNGVSHPKMVTRIGLAVKIGLFSLKNGDEIEARRQN
ncbi:hypothetical protein NST54_15670 [Caldifermentibacillus hisashii]|uniref:hypothetical protein n=1 Tax=Caldifermentibacillus hisashii TaxID=996558 RepID=UPI0034D52EB1